MASARFGTADRGGRQMASPRPKGRGDTKDTMCRNVLIYGHCRYEDQGCAFNHDQHKNSNSNDASKKSLNVDSPSFTPAQLSGGKKTNFSTSATPFTPRGATSATPLVQQEGGLYKAAAFSDFAPQNYDLNAAAATNGSTDASALNFDPFTMSSVSQALPAAQFNPYAEDHALASGANSFFSAQSTYTAPMQPLQHHLYYPTATPIKDTLQPHQRPVYDFFLPENIRGDLQSKSHAARQILPNSNLPNPSHYHSLVPLDTKTRGISPVLGYSTWVYKAQSRKTGNVCCLRRVEGYRLTAENAFMNAMAAWKKISHPNVVGIVEAFTTREFNDTSLVFVHHYHALSKTLAEHQPSLTRSGRQTLEKILWGYIVQIGSALRAIHSAGLAARCVDASKIILTDKNRVRLSACAVLDVLRHDERPLEELQEEDLTALGKLILSIAMNTSSKSFTNLAIVRTALEQLGRTISQNLKDRITWLIFPAGSIPNSHPKTAEELIYSIGDHTDDVLASALVEEDEVTLHLGRELENGRLFRLMAKLQTINERPEYDNDPNWSETGERYTLKLFRDYVFHQVDSNGKPVLDLGHIITCLNKLDAGTDEMVHMTSRDNQSSMYVSYKELKKQAASAFGDLQKAQGSGKSPSGMAGSSGIGAAGSGRVF